MPFSPNSLSCPKKLSSEYQLYACGNFSWHSLILEKIAILGQHPSCTLNAEHRNTQWRLSDSLDNRRVRRYGHERDP